MKKLNDYIRTRFGVGEDKFLRAMQMSPGAEGYLQGSLGELLFKKYVESKGFEALRIKEKPKGGYNAKSDQARGNFYIRKKTSTRDRWYVVENKGVKTNTETHLFGLYTKKKLFTHLKGLAFPKPNYLERSYRKGLNTYNKAKARWEHKNPGGHFPKFKWDEKTPGSKAFNLIDYWKSEGELKAWVDGLDDMSLTKDAYLNCKGPIRILATHAPSSRVAPITGIQQTAPLVSDFNVMCVDLFQRTGTHQFVFMNPNCIAHSPTSPEHLYQNYYIDYIIPGVKDVIKISPPWYDDILQCIRKTHPIARKMDESQLDLR